MSVFLSDLHKKKYEEREQLFADAAALKETKRVPIFPMVMYLPLNLYEGVTVQDTIEDVSRIENNWLRFYDEYQPDAAMSPVHFLCSKANDTLGCRYFRWPGKHVNDPNSPFQMKEEEFMLQEEYGEFVEDPSGFMVRKMMSRQYEALEGLANLDLSCTVYQDMNATLLALNSPAVKAAIETIQVASEQLSAHVQKASAIGGKLISMGFPLYFQNTASVPFDAFNDTMRGLVNTTMDMLDCPEELEAALNVMTRIKTRRLRASLSRSSNPGRVIFHMHNGFDSLMSEENFRRFYWPGLKACIDVIIEMGGTPVLQLQGKFAKKLHLFAELDPGKVIISFTSEDDITEVKKVLGGKVCISGGFNSALLQYGTPEQVSDTVKRLIDTCAPGGGYILSTESPIDLAKPENLDAFFKAAGR